MMIGAEVGNYKIIGKLAEGGIGEVFEATDAMLNRRAAIKCLRPELATRPEVVDRFHLEAQTLARLNHPNIATIFGFIREGDQPFLAMEFVEGETLEALVKKRGRIEPTVALSLFQQILCAVEFAHNNDVIHRDLKPSNIMLTNAGVVKVMDFGIAHVLGSARRTRTGHMVGTIQYMSPEQIKGEKVDTRSDIYSLGILLYELITGQVPFDSDSDYAIIRAQIEEPPPPPSTFFQDTPPRIEAVLLRALAKAPNDRFQSLSDMAEALEISLGINRLNGSTQRIHGWLHDRRSLVSSAGNSIFKLKGRVASCFKESLAHKEIGWKQYALITFLVLFIVIELIVLVVNGPDIPDPQPRASLPTAKKATPSEPTGSLSPPVDTPTDVTSTEPYSEQTPAFTKTASQGMELQDMQRNSPNSQPQSGVNVSKPKLRQTHKIPAAEPDTKQEPASHNSLTATPPSPSSSPSRENPIKEKAENKLKVEWEN